MSMTGGAKLTAVGPLSGRDTSAKDMTTLLPNELLLMLIHFFEDDAATLAQLSCVSRKLSFMAREPLYKRIKVPSSKLGMQRLLRALLADRRLADLTTSIELVGYIDNINEGPWASQYPDVDGLTTYHYSLAYLGTFSRNFEHRTSVYHMMSQLIRRSTSAYCTVLLTLFPNLEIVHFALYQDQANLCQAPLRAMYEINGTSHTLGRLERLSSSLDKVRQLHIPAANVELLCFFGLRQLHNLHLDFSQRFEDSVPLNGLLYRHRQLPELSVQTINITCGYQEADPEWTEFSEVREVLTRIQHENGAQDGLAALKSVNIIVKDLPHYEVHHTVEMDTLISQLEPVFGGVKELKIESPQLSENVYFHPSLPNTFGDREVLITLRHFKHLQRLEIFQAAIVPRSFRSKPHPEPDLAIMFPLSMKELVITHCSAIVVPWLERLSDALDHYPNMRSVELRRTAKYGRKPSWFIQECARIKAALFKKDIRLTVTQGQSSKTASKCCMSMDGCFWEREPWSELVDMWANDWSGLRQLFSGGI